MDREWRRPGDGPDVCVAHRGKQYDGQPADSRHLTEVQIANIQVTQGTAWVGFTISANSGQWANIESVSLTQN